jgi:hypothetical protein
MSGRDARILVSCALKLVSSTPMVSAATTSMPCCGASSLKNLASFWPKASVMLSSATRL